METNPNNLTTREIEKGLANGEIVEDGVGYYEWVDRDKMSTDPLTRLPSAREEADDPLAIDADEDAEDGRNDHEVGR